MSITSITSALFRPVSDPRLSRVQELAGTMQTMKAQETGNATGGQGVGRGSVAYAEDGTVHYTFNLGDKDDAYAADKARGWTSGFRAQAEELIHEQNRGLKAYVERTDIGARSLKEMDQEVDQMGRHLDIMEEELRQEEERLSARPQTEANERLLASIRDAYEAAQKVYEAAQSKQQDAWADYEIGRKKAIEGVTKRLAKNFGFRSDAAWTTDFEGSHTLGDYTLSFSVTTNNTAGTSFTSAYRYQAGETTLTWSSTVNGRTTATTYSGGAALAFLSKPYESAGMQALYGPGSAPGRATRTDIYT
ncbi:MAG TPA: hypothetical protein VD978_20160 [Azospirillum sp.]|nr:hypothetical protein [Azospirillum sp.]